MSNLISLGNFCLPSYSIKKMGYKKESYPFDWIISTNEMIVHCIENDFINFLDISKYNSHRFKGKNNAGHLDYGDLTFMHRNPRNDKHYQYFVRCVNRFKNLYTINETIKFIQVVHQSKRYDILNKEAFNKKVISEIKEIKEIISSKINNPAFLFIILHTETKKNKTTSNGDTFIVETSSKENGLYLLNKEENSKLNLIIKDFINE